MKPWKSLYFGSLFLVLFLPSCSCDHVSSRKCASIADCPRGQYCDPASGACKPGRPDAHVPDLDGSFPLPDAAPDGSVIADVPGPDGDITVIEDPVRVCRFVPPPGVFSPRMECHWNGSPEYPEYDDVVMTPVVANVTDDNGDGIIDTRDTPDILFVSYRLREDGCCNVNGVLRVISGRCTQDGTPIEHFSAASPFLDNSAGLAVGDIDGDGVPDIVGMTRTSGTVAFSNTGQVKWTSPYPDGADILTSVQPAITDLDGDGIAEILVGRVVLDGATGAIRWRGVGGLGINAFLGPMSFAADIDLDGRPEVIAGNTVYRADGMLLWQFTFPSANSGCQSQGKPCDGYAAAGDFDGDPEAEIVIVRSGDVWILHHDGTLMAHLIIPWDNCTYNEGGPPTIADFDGDGRVEIGVAGADFYSVFDLDCCDALPGCAAVPAGADYCQSPGVRWSVPNNDCSSRVTGSSVFDFDGDGQAEVIYNDETYFRIFRGTDGTILFQEPNTSHTRLEYPIIADVDNDGNAEIVFIENTSALNNPNHGVEIWGDAADRWVPTRRIWNQHMYFITNISEDGRLPPYGSPPNWLIYNNFRQNLPDYDVFAAPDLQVSFGALDRSRCNQEIGLSLQVCNQGDLRVGPGVPVTLSEPSTGAPIACTQSLATTRTLEPGECETLVCVLNPAPVSPARVDVQACVDNEGTDCLSGGRNNECHEDNNTAVLSADGCNGPIG